jgi:hypothetical protein
MINSQIKSHLRVLNFLPSAIDHNNNADKTTVLTYTLPANTLRAGDIIRFCMSGKLTTNDSSNTIDVAFHVGANETIYSSAGATVTGQTFFLNAEYIIMAIGASGKYTYQAMGIKSAAVAFGCNHITSYFDTTADIELKVTLDWTTADAGDNFNLQGCYITLNTSM